MTYRLFSSLLLLLFLASPAQAEIYKYRTAEGELVLTTERRDDLELIEIIGEASVPVEKKSTQSPKKSTQSRSKDKDRFDPIIAEAAEAYDLPFAFIKAVIKIESNFNPHAVSRVGAMGLMQLMPATAEDMGVEDAFDPYQNIFGGTKYLRLLANKYDGDINLVLASYNAGPGNVDKYDGIPFKATQGYVKKVYHWYQEFSNEGQE